MPEGCSSVRLFESVLPTTLLQQVLHEAEELASSPNYWIPQKDFHNSNAKSPPSALAVQHLYRLLKSQLPSEIAGAEYWVQVYEPGRGLDFHFDKDELLMKERSEMQHPRLSSILYLTGGISSSMLGPTVIINQRFDNATRSPCPARPEGCTMVWPRANTFAVFDGALGHGVLESPAKGERITLLVNWWTYQPMAIFERPPKDRQASPVDSKAVDLTEATEIAGLSLDDVHIKEVIVAELTIPESLAHQPHMVDELLQTHGLALNSQDAIQALTISHKGYMLYPMLSDEDPDFQSLQTPAAFIPHHLLESGSDSEDS